MNDSIYVKRYVDQACQFNQYSSDDWSFYVTNTNITPEECGFACYDYSECTGFEISQYGSSKSPYCAFWYNGACSIPNTYGYAPRYDITTYTIIDYGEYIWFNYWIFFVILFAFLLLCVCACIKGCGSYCQLPKRLSRKVYFAEVVIDTTKNEDAPIVAARAI